MIKKDDLGDRMKCYENVTKHYLTRRTPTIIRIDGKAFHSFTKGFKKPFDEIMMKSMWDTAKYLCENIQGCKIAYTQSDEITLLLTDYDKLNTSAWFDDNIQKIVSVSASMATLAFNNAFKYYTDKCDDNNIYKKKIGIASFDSRVFNLPKEEVCNCFIWRQLDAMRNSVQMIGRANFSHKELFKVSCEQMQNKLLKEKDINWSDYPIYQQRGVCIIKEQYQLNNEQNTIRNRWIVDKEIPIFNEDRDYVAKYL